MAVKFSNNVSTTLAAGISPTDTSISVVDASSFPALGAGEHTYVTFDSDTVTPIREVVKVTAVSGTTLTVVRGQDGTAAAAFSAGAKVELRITAVLLDELSRSGWEVTATAPTDGSGKPNGYIWFVV
jgi:hypothetical protein